MTAQYFATAGYFAPGRDITMADHMLDVVIRAEGQEVAELVSQYKDSQVAADDRTQMHDLASASGAAFHGWVALPLSNEMCCWCLQRVECHW